MLPHSGIWMQLAFSMAFCRLLSCRSASSLSLIFFLGITARAQPDGPQAWFHVLHGGAVSRVEREGRRSKLKTFLQPLYA